MARPFPTLAAFLIFKRETATNGIGGSDASASQVEAPLEEEGTEAAPEEVAGLQGKEPSRSNGLPSSTLFFLSRSPASDEGRARIAGLAQGMVDFAQMLGTGLGGNGKGGDGIRVVKSARQRMLYFEAERGFWICAIVNLPRPALAGSKLSSTLGSGSASSAPPPPPSDEALLASLRRGYLEFRLLHGSFSTLSGSQPPSATGSRRLEEALQKFWSVWVWRWDVERSVHGSIDFAEHLGSLHLSPAQSRMSPSHRALLDRFIASTCPKAGAIPLLFYGSSLLHLPIPNSSSPATSDDIATLALYLLSLLHGSEATPEISGREAKDEAQANVEDEKAGMITKSKWSGFGLGLGSLGGLLSSSPSARSGTASPDVDASKATEAPSASRAADETKGSPSLTSNWAHRAISWALPSSSGSASHSHAQEAEDLDAQLRREMGLPPLRRPDPKLAAEPRALPAPCAASNDIPLTEAPPEVPPASPPVLPSIPIPHISLSATLAQTPPLSLSQASQIPLPEDVAHDPCSPSFSIEGALADAMTEAQKRQILAQQAAVEAKKSISPEAPPESVTDSKPITHPNVLPEKEEGTVAWPNGNETLKKVDDKVVLKKLEVFVGCEAEAGRHDVPAKVFWLQRGYITLALLVAEPSAGQDPSAEQRSSISSHELIAEGSQLVTSLYARLGAVAPKPLPVAEQRYLIQSSATGLTVQRCTVESKWITREETWSGKPAAPKDVQASRALLDIQAFGNANPPASETFVRTGTGQWVIGKGNATSAPSGGLPVEAYLVLPVGAGTLIDADGELRKLTGAYQQFGGL